MKKSLSFKTKLVGLCLFLGAVSIVIGAVSYWSLHDIEESYDQVTEVALPSRAKLKDMFLEYRAVRINLRTLGLPDLTKEKAQEYIGRVTESIENYEKLDKEYRALPDEPGQKELYEKVSASWEHFNVVGKNALDFYHQGTPEAMAKMNKIFLEDCPAAAKEYTVAVLALQKFHTEKSEMAIAAARHKAKQTNQLVFILTLVGVLSGVIIGFIFATKISTTIGEIVKSLSANANEMTFASGKIAGSAQELSQAATEQASSLEETAASLEEITAMIHKATESASSTAARSTESQKKAEEGRTAVDQMLSSMDEISQSNESILTQINESNRQMAEIVHVIQEIGNKTKVINEIVFQTKLLSFNASVEAARAGEHGKGFAVVAEEVGNLAQMSGNAAKEIGDMLGASTSKVERIVDETKSKVEILVQSGKEKIDSGVTVAKQCANILNEIVSNVSHVSGLSQEISQASKEQSQGVSEINVAITQLNTVTQQNTSASEQAASASVELSAQAESLKSSVDQLVWVMQGSHVHSVAKPASAVQDNQSNVIRLKKSESSKNQKLAKVSGEPQFKSAPLSTDSAYIPARDDDGFDS